jgi:phage gpG-like protein
MAEVTVRVEHRSDGGLDRLIAAMENPRAAYEAGRGPLAFARDHAFSQEGPGWQGLSAQRVAERGEAHPILEVTGSYRESFRPEADDDGLELVTRDERAGLHQFGGRSGQGGQVPPRPVVVSAADRDAVTEAVVDTFLGRR